MFTTLVMTVGLFVLAVVSGMLGLGVAFAAIPFLSLFMSDLVHQVQPLSLLLNGITALFSVLGFAKSRLIDWKKALLLSEVTVIYAPLGAWLASANIVKPIYIWVIYLISVFYLAYRLMAPARQGQGAKISDKGTTSGLPFYLLPQFRFSAGFWGLDPVFFSCQLWFSSALSQNKRLLSTPLPSHRLPSLLLSRTFQLRSLIPH
jgi:uncharacterized membrane protein YfcA